MRHTCAKYRRCCCWQKLDADRVLQADRILALERMNLVESGPFLENPKRISISAGAGEVKFGFYCSVGRQVGVVVINHASHLFYKRGIWAESQLISTWLRGFTLGTPDSSLIKTNLGQYLEGHKFIGR